jgi:hypothetical protein
LFNPWGTQSNGYAPGETDKIYGLFFANAAFISQNFDEQCFGTGAANTDDLAGPADEFIEPATLDNAGPKKAAIVRGNGSYSTATAYTRPAQGTAIGTDPWDAS